MDVLHIAELLKSEGIDSIISSSYQRAILTIEGLAKTLIKEIVVEETV